MVMRWMLLLMTLGAGAGTACTSSSSDPLPSTPSVPTDTDTDADDDDTAAEAGAEATVDAEIASLIHVTWPASWGGEQAVVAWRLSGEAEQFTPARLTEGGGEPRIVVLGVPFSAEVSWRLLLDGVEVAGGVVETGAPPGGLRPPVVVSSSPEGAGQDPSLRYLLLSVSSAGYRWPTWTVIVDRQGRLVWARQTPDYQVTMHPRLSVDGRSILVDQNSFWGAFDGGAASEVVRLTLDGAEVERMALPGLHHAFTELPDGTLLWGGAREGGATEVLMSRSPSGVLTELWSCADFLASLGETRACGSNTVSWHAATDTVLYSLYSVESVVEVDRQTGETLRWFGHLPGAWSFSAPDEAFWWQHGVHFTPEGTLLLSARTAPGVEETVAREYALDASTQTLRQVWSFGLGAGVYGAKMGEAWRLPGGNILHNYGSTPRIREATAEGEVVWDIGWTSLQFIGRSVPLSDLYALLPP